MSAGVIAASYVATTSYSVAILADTPLAYWRMGDPSGGFADSSGNGFNLGPLGTGTFTRAAPGLLVGDPDKALQITAVTTSGATITSAPWMNVPTLTVSALTKTTSTATQWVVGRDNNGGALSWRLNQGVNGQFILNVGGTLRFCTGSHNIVTNTTYLWQARYTGSVIELYWSTAASPTPTLDGSLTISGTPVYQQSIRVGSDSGGTSDFLGTIDEIAYFGTSLSTTRLAAHAAAAFQTA